jgi:hypothetical protein
MSFRGFARVDGFGNYVGSQLQGVTSIQPAVHESGSGAVRRGAYCFKLTFAPVVVIATSIAHPDDSQFGPTLYAAAPNVAGVLTKDLNGFAIVCPPASQVSLPEEGWRCWARWAICRGVVWSRWPGERTRRFVTPCSSAITISATRP